MRVLFPCLVYRFFYFTIIITVKNIRMSTMSFTRHDNDLLMAINHHIRTVFRARKETRRVHLLNKHWKNEKRTQSTTEKSWNSYSQGCFRTTTFCHNRQLFFFFIFNFLNVINMYGFAQNLSLKKINKNEYVYPFYR